ncbi:MATE family efflux transporter [Candidatus Woesearchaeota archaeon]|nr:MATE family efflux transporter [Candidatus Woesearchaeota archaeon]
MARDLINGNITKTILALSWPTMIAMLLQVGFNIVDTIFVGRLGPEAIAAVSIVFPVVFLMFALGGGLGIGTTSLIARYIGAERVAEADNAAEHSFIIAIVLSILFTISGLLFADKLFFLMGATPEVIGLASNYSRWIFGFSLFMFIGLAAISILRGLGDMKTPMIGMVIATVLNIILDPLLIFGIGPFPELGIDGAALATVISRFLAVIIMMGFIFSSITKVSIKPRHFKFRKFLIKEILRVGIPSSINQSMMSLAIMVITRIVAFFGPIAIAAYGIAFRVESLVILPILGIATAVITMVGQNVGAKRFSRAERSVWAAAKISAIFVLPIAVLLFIFPGPIYSIFSNDALLISYGIDLLRILSPIYIFAAVAINIASAFQGAGHATPALVMTALRLFIFSIPLALLFSFTLGFGLNGVWIGAALATFFSSIISMIWFKMGTWKKETLK